MRTDSLRASRVLLTEGAAYIAIEISQQALALVALPVFFFKLTFEEFGLITWAIVLAQISMTLGPAGLDFSVIRLYFRWSPGERASEMSGIYWLVSGWSALLALIAPALTLSAVMGPSPIAGREVLLLGWWSGLVLGVRSVGLSVLRVRGLMRQYAWVVLGGAALQMILQIALVLAGTGARGYMYAYVLAAGASTIVAQLLLPERSQRGCRLPTGDTLRYTASILPSALFNRLLLAADRLVVGRWVGLADLGLYGAATRFTTPIRFMSGGLKTALAPVMSRQEADGVDANEVSRLGQVAVLAMLLVGSIVVIGVWFVQFTPWGSRWSELQRLVGLLLLAQLLSGLAFLGQTQLYYTKRPQLASVVVGAAAIVLIVSLIVLVPRFGSLGAALAQMLSGGAALAALAIVSPFASGQPQARWQLPLLCSFLPSLIAMWLLASPVQLLVFVLTVIGYGWIAVHFAQRMGISLSTFAVRSPK